MDREKLDLHFENLAALKETDSPVISCYVNLESGYASYRDELDARIREVRGSLPKPHRTAFEEALFLVERYLAKDTKSSAEGAAIFARAGEVELFDALQFRVPLPTSLSVDSVPHLYELVKLKDTYDRYVVVITTEAHARIVEVNIGEITKTLWTERPELRARVGREWTKEHYQKHQRDRTNRFFKEKVSLLEQLFADREHTHLLLAGDTRSVSRLRNNLPKHLLDRLVDVVPAARNTPTEDIVKATLSAFAEHEQAESMETSWLLLDELNTGGLAVAGTPETLKALTSGQADLLVISEAYEPPPGWACRECGAIGIEPIPQGCPQCGKPALEGRNIKEEIIRAAKRIGVGIEIVRLSDVLFEIGGIGCLLRYLTPEQRNRKSL